MVEKFYISGPITGRVNLNREAFEKAENDLRALGYDVFNPQSIPPPTPWPKDPEHVWRYFMKACVKELPDCDSIFMLEGWRDSRGGRWEHDIAVMLGLRVYYPENQSSTTAREPSAGSIDLMQ